MPLRNSANSEDSEAPLTILTELQTSSIEDLLCKACWANVFNTEGIQNFWNRNSKSFTYSTTWQSIAQAAGAGCNWCSFLRVVLPCPEEPMWPRKWNQNWTPTRDLLVNLEEAWVSVDSTPAGLNQCELNFGLDENNLFDWYAEVDFFVEKSEEVAHIITARPLRPVVNSFEARTQIIDWLSKCGQHTDCNQTKYSTLPSRVIDVAPANSPEMPRLLSAKHQRGQYLALSYCWGLDQKYVLTSQNVGDLERALDIAMLPQTIRDAIEITKALEFRYLWVDALCIMQDTPEDSPNHDMHTELAVMDQIYEGARMTIVAACASSCNDGFLKPRNEPKGKQFKIPCRRSPTKACIIQLQEHIQYDDLREPINRRAWTLQEQLLSPRLLIYASHTLQWQCRTLTCNLGGAYHAPRWSATSRLPSIKMLVDGTAPLAQQQWKHGPISYSILKHWLEVVISYSGRKISAPSDKLTAIAALAAYFAPIFGPKYFAGIWEKSFLQQLNWYRTESLYFYTRPLHYRAPSWSWASIDGPVNFDALDGPRSQAYRCEFIECSTTPKVASLPYGEVAEGHVTLNAVMRPAWLNATRSQIVWTDGMEAGSNAAQLNLPSISSDTEEDKYDRSVGCLALYVMKETDLPIGGLMLASLPDGRYQRIGRFLTTEADFVNLQPAHFTII